MSLRPHSRVSSRSFFQICQIKQDKDHPYLGLHEVGLSLANSAAPRYEELPHWIPPWARRRHFAQRRTNQYNKIGEELRANAKYHQERIDEIKQDQAAGRVHFVEPYEKEKIRNSLEFSAEAIRPSENRLSVFLGKSMGI